MTRTGCLITHSFVGLGMGVVAAFIWGPAALVVAPIMYFWLIAKDSVAPRLPAGFQSWNEYNDYEMGLEISRMKTAQEWAAEEGDHERYEKLSAEIKRLEEARKCLK